MRAAGSAPEPRIGLNWPHNLGLQSVSYRPPVIGDRRINKELDACQSLPKRSRV